MYTWAQYTQKVTFVLTFFHATKRKKKKQKKKRKLTSTNYTYMNNLVNNYISY